MSARTRILAHQLNAVYHTAVGRQHAVKYSGQFQVTASIVGNVLVGIHAALEFFYSQQLAGEAEPSLDELLNVCQQSWRDRSEQEVRFNKSETADSLHSLADKMLKAFLASDLTKQDGRIIGVEEELRGELSGRSAGPAGTR